MDMAKVKIRVLRKIDTGDIRQEYGEGIGECPALEVGQEFVVEDLAMPHGFCPWAWADIQRDIIHLALNGDFFWMKKKGTMVSCCTDGLRPVIFEIERIED